MQLSVIANIFVKVMTYLCGRFNTNMSIDIDNTNIFQILAFHAYNLISLPPFCYF